MLHTLGFKPASLAPTTACTIAYYFNPHSVDMLLMASTNKMSLFCKNKRVRCNLSTPVGKRGDNAVSEDV